MFAVDTHRIVSLQELQDEGGDGGHRAEECVDARQRHECRAGHREEAGEGVHHWGDGPAGEKQNNNDNNNDNGCLSCTH